MSFTQHASTATCTLSVNTVDEAVTLLTDWLGNNPDEFPDSLSEDGAESEIADELSPYISRDESGQIIVSVDSESDDGNYSSDVFDFITSHFAEIQTSEYMTVTWSCFLSRDGMSSGTDYHNQDGKYFYISSKSKDSKALDSIAALLSGTEWNVDTLMSISDLVTGTGREIKDLEN
jgi:hypothetical protein